MLKPYDDQLSVNAYKAPLFCVLLAATSRGATWTL